MRYNIFAAARRLIHLKIYLDNCCYNRPYDDQSQVRVSLESQAKLYIQRQIVARRLELVSSYVLLSENLANPVKSKRENIRDFIDANSAIFVSSANEDKIDMKAEEIMRTGIKYADACHVACAILAGCESFITTDKRLLKYQTDEIRMLNPVNFVSEWEEEQNGG